MAYFQSHPERKCVFKHSVMRNKTSAETELASKSWDESCTGYIFTVSFFLHFVTALDFLICLLNFVNRNGMSITRPPIVQGF